MKRFLCLVMSLLLILSAGGCSPTPVEGPSQTPEAMDDVEFPSDDFPAVPVSAFASLDELLIYTNARHGAVRRPELDLQALVAAFEKEEFDLTSYQEEREFDPDQPLTSEQLIRDLDVLHSILRSHYPAYYHFGGREVFEPLFAEMIADAQAAEPDSLTAQSAISYLSWHLGPVIRDFHFTVNQAYINPPILPYRVGDRDFMRTDDGYVELESGRQVASVSGVSDLDGLFKLAIAEDGAIVYWPILVEYHEYAPPEAITIIYEDGGTEERTPHVIQAGFYSDLEDYAALDWREDVPVIHTAMMGYEYGDAHRPFLDCLEPVREEPLLLVDLRGNGGGNMILSMQWLEEYAGQAVPTNAVTVTVQTNENYDMDPQSEYYVSYESGVEHAPLVPINDRYSTIDRGAEDLMIANADRLLVVLTAKPTASAAETFVETAYNLENTLFVGNNTAGAQLGTGSIWVTLPESGVRVGIPRNLTVYQDGFLPEFRGVEPDLWVDGDAEEMVLRMLTYLE